MRHSDFGPLEIPSFETFVTLAKAEFHTKWSKSFVYEEKLDDFEFIKILGHGTFGKVILVKNKLSHRHRFHAMKIIEKKRVVEKKQVNNTRTEKKILQCMCHPFMISLDFVFQDNNYIYLVMPHIPGGDFYSHLKKFGKFDEEQSQFYCAQVILAIEFLHCLQFIYRDIKPENILIDHTGYLKLTDFGFCKRLEKGRTYTMCGTPEYMAPEVIQRKGYGMAADWWSLGILIFELNAGTSPFHAKSLVHVYKKILKNRFITPLLFSSELKDIVSRFLQEDISLRLGNLKNGVNDIKQHKWFVTINWLSLLSRKLQAPYKPAVDQPSPTLANNVSIRTQLELRMSTEDKFKDLFQDFI